MSKITNLIGTTWRLDGVILPFVTEQYGEFMISNETLFYKNGVLANVPSQFDGILVGYYYEDGTYTNKNRSITFGSMAGDFVNFYFQLTATNYDYVMVTITGGTDISNPLFIDFINTYGTLVSGGEPKVTITYNENVIASLGAGQTATLQCNGKKMASDIIVTAPEIENSPLPIEVATEEEMNALLETAEIGDIYKYTGETTDAYENGALYVVEESE